MRSGLTEALRRYGNDVQGLAQSDTTSEPTYYSALRGLIAEVLNERKLPSNVHTNTTERREGGGVDLPDIAVYDEAGDIPLLFVEVKLPEADIHDLAKSIERNNQVGRYLARSRVLVVTNIRGFALISVMADAPAGPVMPEHRRIEQIVDLWPGLGAFKSGGPTTVSVESELSDLLELALTAFATINEPSALAKVLANQARRAKANLPEEFSQAVKSLQDDFAQALGIAFEGPDGEEFFRSSLVQTVFYALFAGWALHTRSKTKKPFTWQDLPTTLRIPFLGRLFYDIQHPDRILELGLTPFLDRASETLDRVDASTFFAKLRGPSLFDDPEEQDVTANAVLYFYEPFLEAFDPELRKMLGVWYTPVEVVRYQIRKVESILMTELGCPRGFADERVVVLDPCCGTGAYLIEVLRSLARTLKAEGNEADLGDRLIDALCHRVIGFEILTAPFVIAHLQLFLVLASLGVEPKATERLAVFLTNALTGWDGPEQLKLNFPELQQEHDLARQVKQGTKIIVVIGNPPYNRFAGVPVAEESDLADTYKGIARDAKGRQQGQSKLFTEWGIRKHLLDDLYIRFFRLAELRIAEHAEFGIVSFISNSSFFGGRSHPIMRESLLRGFSAVYIDNLNGDKYKTGKVIPKGLPGAGSSDQSVFSTEQDSRGIQVGTGITTLVKLKGGARSLASVHYRDFWGKADAKRAALLASLDADSNGAGYEADSPAGPRKYVPVQPTKASRFKLLVGESVGGYDDWPGVDELFPTFSMGLNGNRGLENSVIDLHRPALTNRMKDYYSDSSWAEFAERNPELAKARARYEPEQLRALLRSRYQFEDSRITPIQIGPLDLRYIYYEDRAKLISERAPLAYENLNDNAFLLVVPQPRRLSESRPMYGTGLYGLHLHDRGTVGYFATVSAPKGNATLFDLHDEPRTSRANLSPAFWAEIARAHALSGSLADGEAKHLARRLQFFCLAIGHTPQFEEEHAEALALGVMRVPIPKEQGVFNTIADLGAQIAALLDPLADARQVMDAVLGPARTALAVVKSVDGGPLREADFAVTIAHFGAAKGGWRETSAGGGDMFINSNVCFANVPEVSAPAEKCRVLGTLAD